MANGLFLGGMADSIQAGNELSLKRDTLAADTGLRTRGLDIQQQQADLEGKKLGQDYNLRTRALNLTEQAQKFSQSREVLTRVDKQIDETMAIVTETVSQALSVGKDATVVAKAVQPLVDSAKSLAVKAGRNPTDLDVRVNTLFARPTGTESAAAAGRAEATKKVESAKTIAAATGEGVDIDPYKDPKDKVQLENSLRDDYVKQAKDFITIRDAKTRIDSIENTGAGDVALVFQYMKILDPGSTVREGEFATASNAAGVPAAVVGMYNKAVGGGLLAPKARSEIRSQADKLYQSQAVSHDRMTTQFANIAKRQKLDVKNIIVDFRPGEMSANGRVGAGFGDLKLPPPPAGFNIVPGR